MQLPAMSPASDKEDDVQVMDKKLLAVVWQYILTGIL